MFGYLFLNVFLFFENMGFLVVGGQPLREPSGGGNVFFAHET